MVRKRSRKYDSDNSDSDVDWDPAVATRGPAAKKYSLRERKGGAQSFCEFDYLGLDEEEEAPKSPKLTSEDEDFEVEADIEPMRQFYEPSEPEEAEEAQCSEGLIDFEDIIRADIVVNKNKIDYDNIIQKTEIKLTQAPPAESQPPKRRGRKPKNWALKSEIKDEIKSEVKEEGDEQDPENDQLEPKTEVGESEVKKEPLEEGENMSSDVNSSDVLPNGDCTEHEANSENIDASSIQEPNKQPVDDEQPTCSTVDTSRSAPEAKADSNVEMSNTDSKSNSQKSESKSDDDDDVIVLDNNTDVIVLDD